MVKAPRVIPAHPKLRINPAAHPAAAGTKAGKAARAEAAVVVAAANGRVVTPGNAINVSVAATVVALGNPTVLAAVVLVVMVEAGLARCIRRSRFRPLRLKFLAICQIPRVSPIWLISIRSPWKFPPAEASRWCWTISTR
jgi:hypothetical protein